VNIYQKMIEVRKAVPALEKDNQGHGFKYVSSSQVLNAIRAAMDEVGLLLMPQVAETAVRDHTTQQGKSWYFTELTMHYTWVNAEKPDETIPVSWYGQGLDDGEKGVGKALTYAEKYLILKTFNVPTDKDDPDAHAAPEREQPPRRQEPPPGPGTKEHRVGQTVPNAPSEKQIGRLWAIAGSNGWTNEQVHLLIGSKFNAEHCEQLTRDEYNWLCGDDKKKIKGALEYPPDRVLAKNVPGAGDDEPPASDPDDPTANWS